MPAPVPPVDKGKPMFHRALRERFRLDELDASYWAEISRTYYGMVSRVDAQLGRIVQSVDRLGATDRTATFVFTDHGEYLGDFGLVEKWASGMEPGLTKMPLIGAIPGGPEANASDAMVEMVDMMPTILELAGLETKHSHFGKSFMGPLTGDDAAGARSAAFTDGGLAADDLRRMAGLQLPFMYGARAEMFTTRPELMTKTVAMRTHDHTYVYRLHDTDELYDRRDDPEETMNLVDDPAVADVARTMRDGILEWMVDTSDVLPDPPDGDMPKITHGYR
jgi:arylsulfatase A-like enzyme